MGLTSKLFRGDTQLEACLVSDPAHVVPGATGPHVAKIQFALTVMGLAVISAEEIAGQRYGPSNPTPPIPPPGPLPIPPVPVEPVARKFAIRGAVFHAGLFLEEPVDNTTLSSPSVANCFQVFDLDNMPFIQLDDAHVAIYFREGPGITTRHIFPEHFKRMPRIVNLAGARPLSNLNCRCTYRTTIFNDQRRESFLDLHFTERTISVPMFIHFQSSGPSGSAPSVTVSQDGFFRFDHRGF